MKISLSSWKIWSLSDHSMREPPKTWSSCFDETPRSLVFSLFTVIGLGAKHSKPNVMLGKKCLLYQALMISYSRHKPSIMNFMTVIINYVHIIWRLRVQSNSYFLQEMDSFQTWNNNCHCSTEHRSTGTKLKAVILRAPRNAVNARLPGDHRRRFWGKALLPSSNPNSDHTIIVVCALLLAGCRV